MMTDHMQSDLIAGFIGFPIPEDVHDEMDTLLHNLRNQVQEHQGARNAKVVLDLVDESMNTFFLEPVSNIGMSSVGEKMVHAGANTVKKAVGMLVSSLSKKLTNQEMLPLADYLWRVIYTDLSKEDPVGHSYMASPIDEALHAELNKIVAEIEAGETGAEIEDRLTVAFLEVSEISLDIFFAKPVQMLKLGLVMRKGAKMAYEGTRAAVRGVIKQAFKGMKEKQLRGVAQYVRSVRFARERFIETVSV